MDGAGQDISYLEVPGIWVLANNKPLWIPHLRRPYMKRQRLVEQVYEASLHCTCSAYARCMQRRGLAAQPQARQCTFSTFASAPQLRKTSTSMPPLPPQPVTRTATPPAPSVKAEPVKVELSPRTSPKVPARAAPRQTAASAAGLPPKPQMSQAPTGLASLPPKPEVDPPPPPSSMTRSTIPYAPKFRRTPASSVLIPLSPAEMERYRNFPGGVGTMLLRKRKREDAGVKRDASVKLEEDGDEDKRKRRKTGDVAVVVKHCESARCLRMFAFVLTAGR